MAILVLNVGLKNVRSIIFANDGRQIASATRGLNTSYEQGFVEQNPADWVRLSEEVIKESISELPTDAESVNFFTITTSASCLVALDAEMQPLMNSILVFDSRAQKEALYIDELSEFQKIKNKGFKSSADLMLPKILWLQRNKPDLYEKCCYFSNISDYLYSHFTGVLASDPITSMKFYYLNDAKSYPIGLLSELHLSEEMLPSVMSCGAEVEKILPSLCERLGLQVGCVAALSTYDAIAATIGNGALKAGDAVDISGTVTSFRVVSDNHLLDKKDRLYSVPHIVENQWLLGGSNNQGGGIIEWAKKAFYSEIEEDPSIYSVIESEARSVGACEDGLIFIPHLLGERAPVWNTDSRGVFFGLTPTHVRPNFTRAILESLAFSVYHSIETINELGVEISGVSVSGGLSQFDLVNQIKSDLFNVEIKQFNNFETTAIGAAIIALKGQGVYSCYNEALSSFVNISRIYHPCAESSLRYKRYFSLYKEIYESLANAFVQRREIERELG